MDVPVKTYLHWILTIIFCSQSYSNAVVKGNLKLKQLSRETTPNLNHDLLNDFHCYDCWFNYNKELMSCIKPLCDLVDPDNTCNWQNSSTLSINTLKCCSGLVVVWDVKGGFRMDKVCSSLTRWDQCITLLSKKCVCKNLEFYDFKEMMKTKCVTIGELYFDCLKRINGNNDMQSAYYKPGAVCEYMEGEILAIDLLTLNFLQFWLEFSPNKYQLGDIMARKYCKSVEVIACKERRMQFQKCPYLHSHLDMDDVVDQIYGLSTADACGEVPLCEQYIKSYCELKPIEYKVELLKDVSDISVYYNQSNKDIYRENILKYSDFLGGFYLTNDTCNVQNLLFKQVGCVMRMFADLDLTQLPRIGYFQTYLTKHLKYFTSCNDVYIGACPNVKSYFQYIPTFLKWFTILHTTRKTDCPIHMLLYTRNSAQEHLHFPLFLDMFTEIQQLVLYWKAVNNKSISEDNKNIIRNILSIVIQGTQLDTEILSDKKYTFNLYNDTCGLNTAMTVMEWWEDVSKTYPMFYQAINQTFAYIQQVDMEQN